MGEIRKKWSKIEFWQKLNFFDNYKFGLSTLHYWIRFMECILHISYNIDFKESSARGNNKILKQNKKSSKWFKIATKHNCRCCQTRSWNDKWWQYRWFFANPGTVSNIIGVDQKLIKRFGNILHVIASDYQIDCDKFEKYAHETAELFVYSWYNMSPSVHKVLIHGAIMKKMIFPVECLSEETQEAGNKIFKAAKPITENVYVHLITKTLCIIF